MTKINLFWEKFSKLNNIVIRANAPLSVIAKQMNTSEKMLHSAYLDDDDILLSEEYNKMYSKKNVQWRFKMIRESFFIYKPGLILQLNFSDTILLLEAAYIPATPFFLLIFQ